MADCHSSLCKLNGCMFPQVCPELEREKPAVPPARDGETLSAASVPPKPPTLSEARSLIGLIEELASLVADHRAMGIGEVSIANAIRALYMDRWLDQWCNSVEAEPLEESLIDRIESRRSAVRTLMLENAESERTVAALRAEVSELKAQVKEWRELYEANHG